MNSPAWFLLVGGLLLAMGLTVPLIRRLPVTSAMIYLAVGILVGPMGLGLFHFNPLKQSALLEVLTEVAVLISLFAAGVKMPVPVTFARWRAPVLLAVLSMIVSVVLVSAWGFLAVFFAAVTLRQTELRLAGGATELRQRLHTVHSVPFSGRRITVTEELRPPWPTSAADTRGIL